MLSTDWWGLLMVLAVIVLPLWMAWLLLAWSERRRDPGQRSKGRDPP